MSVLHGLVASKIEAKSDAITARPSFSWPLAVAVIGGASVGLWVVIFRVFKLLLAP